MKKLFFAAIAVFALFNVNAQGELRAGVNVGTTIGDFSDLYGIGFGVDATYLFEVSDSFQAGFATGFNTVSGEDSSETIGFEGFETTVEVEAENFNYIPLAAAGRFNVSDAFVIGADVGYAIPTGEGDGGFYYAPVVAYNITEDFQAGVSYRGVSADGGSFSSINLGVNYKFF